MQQRDLTGSAQELWDVTEAQTDAEYFNTISIFAILLTLGFVRKNKESTQCELSYVELW